VNFKSSSGPSALRFAVDDGLTDIVKFFLEVGTDPNIPDHVRMALTLALLFHCLML
jgi:hypothetical protein